MTKWTKTLALAAVSILAVAGAAQADVIAYWNYNEAPGNPQAADAGAGSFSYTISPGSLNWSNSNATRQGTSGNELEDPAASPNGAIYIQTGSNSSPYFSGELVWQVNATNYTDLAFSMAAYTRSGGDWDGPTNADISWSTDGVNYTLIGNIDIVEASDGGYALESASAGANLDAAATAYFKLHNFTFDVAPDNDSRDITMFDNVQINGTLIPEPATMSLLALGGLVALRRRRR